MTNQPATIITSNGEHITGDATTEAVKQAVGTAVKKTASRATRAAAQAKKPAPAKPKAAPTAVAKRGKGTVSKTAKPAAKTTPAKAKGPKTDTAKNDLALAVVTAALSIPGLSRDEKQTVANWIHHLPTGGGTGSARRWPKGAPKPQRSDWA